jgi:hypothetical protein
MTTLWLILCGVVFVPILLGQLIHHGAGRCVCCRRRQPPLRLTIDVTRTRHRDAG